MGKGLNDGGRWGLLLLLAGGVGLAVPAVAHHKVPHREVTLQLDTKGIAALWRAKLFGPPADWLWHTHDRDRDGRLSTAEEAHLAAAVMAKAMRGAAFFLEGAPLELVAMESRVHKKQSGGPLEVWALVNLASAVSPPDRRRTLRVSLRHGGDLLVAAQGWEGWRIVTTSRGALDGTGALAEPVRLKQDQSVVLTFMHPGQGE